MKLSINTVVHGACPGREAFTSIEAVRFLAGAGFQALDMSFGGSIRPENYMQRDDWRQSVQELAAVIQECGVEVSQCHLPFYNFATPGQEELERKAEMFGRSLEAAAMIGVKWAVFHTGNAPDAVLSVKESKRRTLEYIKPFFARAQELGVGIAIENLFIPAYLNSTHRYCSTVEEIIDIVDTLGEGAGVCWDFGHANLIGDNQCDCLRALGGRLRAVHVHDNNGKHDDHSMPYSYDSNVPWQEVLPVLGEIGYSGNFDLELIAGKVPESLRPAFIRYAIDTGRQMMSLTGCEV